MYDKRTALVVVDVQNDFADPAGSLFVSGGEDVVAAVNHEVERALKASALVVYTADWHPPDTPHFAKDGGPWPAHCVADTWGAAFHSDLRVEGEVVRKGTGGEDGYSGFTVRDADGAESATGLEELLRDHEIERVVVVGLATDYCVKATAVDAATKGFETTGLKAAMAAVDLEPGDGPAALAAMEDAGVSIR